jgi:hypothetical protein
MLSLPLLKKISFYITAITIVLFFVAGCTKDEDEPDDPTGSTTGTPVTGNFNWTLSNGSSVVADSAVCYPQITTIYGYKTGLDNTVEINLADVVVGTYDITSFSGNELKYVRNKITTKASSGTVKITGNTGGKMAGNFSATFSTGTITSITGEFSDVRSR